MNEVVGILRGKTKEKNEDYTVLHLVGEFEDYQKSAIGNAVQNVYIKGYLDVPLGSNIELIYGIGYQGKAVVKSVKVLK